LVIREIDELPFDFFLDIFLLFKLENMRVELHGGLTKELIRRRHRRQYLLLKLLVGVVYAKLFKGILRTVLG
jgi:hypothetical protein